MSSELSGELTLLTIILALVVAGLVTFLSYYKKQGDLPKIQYYGLILLRFVGVFLLGLLFINPIIKNTGTSEQRAKVLVAFDNSESMLYAEKQTNSEVQQVVDAIGSGINSDFDVEILSFGQVVNESKVFQGSEGKSDYNQLIRSVNDDYIGQNINSLIMIGDGIYTTGSNPVFHNYRSTFPIYTLGLGDTTGVIDAYIGKIRHNRTTYIGNSFPVQINVGATLCRAKSLKINVTNTKGNTVFSDNITPSNDKYAGVLNFNLSSSEKGKQTYRINIEAVTGEKNLSNNKSSFSIEVVDEKRKILAVSAGPSPDLGMIKRALESQNNYQVDFCLYNSKIPNIKDYDLVIIHSLPSGKNSKNTVLADASAAKVSQLYFIGGHTNIAGLQDAGFKFAQIINTPEQFEAKFSSSFSLFKLDEKIENFIDNAPPVVGSLSSFDVSGGGWSTLATRKIKGVETDYPLIALRSYGGIKQALFLAEGFWKWRMNSYQVFGTHENFDAFVQKMVNFLIVDKNEDNFNIYYSRTYEQGDRVRLTGELYNDNYEIVNDADISIRLTDSAKNVFNYMFDKTGNRYTLDLGSLPVGDYRFDAKVNIGGRDIHEYGHFEVQKLDIEMMQTVADFDMLKQLSEKNGGFFATSSAYNEVLDAINKSASRVNVIEHSVLSSILDKLWLCILVIMIIACEWFLRKYWGVS
ncbi:MAG: hypothetical protein ACK5IQ_05930 [Bacteroidales bacterium]